MPGPFDNASATCLVEGIRRADRAALAGDLRARWQRLGRALRTRLDFEAARLTGAESALRAHSPAARLSLQALPRAEVQVPPGVPRLRLDRKRLDEVEPVS